MSKNQATDRMKDQAANRIPPSSAGQTVNSDGIGVGKASEEPVATAPTASADKPKLTKEQRQAERRPRFLKMAERRVNRAIKALGHVGRFGNRATYDMTEAEAARIAEAIAAAHADMVRSLKGTKKSKEGFSL